MNLRETIKKELKLLSLREETPCGCPGEVGCCTIESHCPEGERCNGKGCCVPNSNDITQVGKLNESFPPNFNLNGCPSPNAQGPFPGQYSLPNWWNSGFGNTFTNHPNKCNFLNNKFNAFMSQINQNMSSGPPSCNPLWNNMLYNKMQILRELSLQIDASSGTSCNHPWT